MYFWDACIQLIVITKLRLNINIVQPSLLKESNSWVRAHKSVTNHFFYTLFYVFPWSQFLSYAVRERVRLREGRWNGRDDNKLSVKCGNAIINVVRSIYLDSRALKRVYAWPLCFNNYIRHCLHSYLLENRETLTERTLWSTPLSCTTFDKRIGTASTSRLVVAK